MKKSKKVFLAAMAVCLIVALSVGGTLAYLQMTTNTERNQFTFVGLGTGGGTDGLHAILEETFDPADAQNLVPGAVVAKAPYVTNDGTVEEYVGVHVVITNPTTGAAFVEADLTDGVNNYTVAELMSYITIDWNSTDWTRFNGTTSLVDYYYYSNTALAVAASTSPLFNSVVFSNTTPTALWEILKTTGFNIVITGSAIQTESIANAAAASALLSF